MSAAPGGAITLGRGLSAVALLVLLASSPLAAFDFGLVVSSQTSADGIAQESAELGQSVVTQGWSEVPVSGRGSVSTQASFRYSLAADPFVNLDELVLDLSFDTGPAAVGRFTLGRFLFDDPTGLILSDPADGVRLGTVRPNLDLAVALGYTGLTHDRVSTVLVSRLDLFDRTDDSPLAPPRLLFDARASFLELFGRQGLTVGLTAQVDLRDAIEVATAFDTVETVGGRVHTGYGTAVFSGPLASGVYYDAFASLNLGQTLTYTGGRYEQTLILAGLFGGSVEVLIPTGVRPTFSLTGFVATGDEDATSVFEGNAADLSRGFEPISTPSLGFLVSPRIQNLLAARLDATVTPFAAARSVALRRVSLTASGIALGRPTIGVATVSGVLPSSDAKYFGTEATIRIDARLLSDFGLTVQGGAFFPNPDAFSDGDLRFRAAFGAAFSL